MAFGSIVVRCEPCHIARILSASIDEENRSGEGEEDQENQEKNNPHGSTPERVEPHKTHKNGR